VSFDNIAIKRLCEATISSCNLSLKLELRDGLCGIGIQVIIGDHELLRDVPPAMINDDSSSWTSCVEAKLLFLLGST
jgi:hypothetical protein